MQPVGLGNTRISTDYTPKNSPDTMKLGLVGGGIIITAISSTG